MLGIAKVLVSEPKLLLMDEPSSGLAPVFVKQVVDVLRTAIGEGTALLIAEQNVAFLPLADRGYLIDGGRMRFSGTREQLESSGAVHKACYYSVFNALDGKRERQQRALRRGRHFHMLCASAHDRDPSAAILVRRRTAPVSIALDAHQHFVFGGGKLDAECGLGAARAIFNSVRNGLSCREDQIEGVREPARRSAYERIESRASRAELGKALNV